MLTKNDVAEDTFPLNVARVTPTLNVPFGRYMAFKPDTQFKGALHFYISPISLKTGKLNDIGMYEWPSLIFGVEPGVDTFDLKRGKNGGISTNTP